MKRILSKLTVMGILLVGSLYFMEDKDASLSNAALENIEALAAGEGGTSTWFCRGSGSLDCPNGTKVKYIVSDYGLN